MSKTKGTKQNRGNFLSRMIEDERREYVRRDMFASCKIAYLKSGMRGYNTLEVTILNISEGGALVKSPIPLERGLNIYLLLKNFPFKISGAIVGMQDEKANIRFSNLIPEMCVHQIASGRPYIAPTKGKAVSTGSRDR